MGVARILIVLALVGCGKSKSPCEQLAPRLMPDPKPDFIKQCELRYEEPKFARMVDCILAIDHPLYEKDIASCPGSEELRAMYFHF